MKISVFRTDNGYKVASFSDKKKFKTWIKHRIRENLDNIPSQKAKLYPFYTCFAEFLTHPDWFTQPENVQSYIDKCKIPFSVSFSV